MNKTKIVCSIGPASCEVNTLEKLIDAGMDVARFNMSHGTHESHKKMIDAVKTARKNKKASIGIMVDTKGPEIRVKQFENGKILLSDGAKFTLTTKDVAGNEERVSITYKNLPKVIGKGVKFASQSSLPFSSWIAFAFVAFNQVIQESCSHAFQNSVIATIVQQP